MGPTDVPLYSKCMVTLLKCEVKIYFRILSSLINLKSNRSCAIVHSAQAVLNSFVKFCAFFNIVLFVNNIHNTMRLLITWYIYTTCEGFFFPKWLYTLMVNWNTLKHSKVLKLRLRKALLKVPIYKDLRVSTSVGLFTYT